MFSMVNPRTPMSTDGEARINILDLTVLSNRGMKNARFERGAHYCPGKPALVHREMGKHSRVKSSLKIVTAEKPP
ncbi:hypothetical protein LPJGGPFB_04911 [Ensifer adhaerens]|nr:hypothetical protein [Ensifer adhaerens]NRP21652.1 hypothetical protein [Ensifer adhaerens]